MFANVYHNYKIEITNEIPGRADKFQLDCVNFRNHLSSSSLYSTEYIKPCVLPKLSCEKRCEDVLYV